MKKTIHIAGNWKMHFLPGEATSFIEKVTPFVKMGGVNVYIAPPYTSIQASSRAAKGSLIHIGAQNMSEHESGAYTGEISSAMIKEAGAQFVILGHSERRTYFCEDNQVIHRKLKRALEEELQPILCVGETDEERSSNQTQAILEKQLREGLRDLGAKELSLLMIAYEPIWAIGTGKTATPEMAEEAHGLIRTYIQSFASREIAKKIPILYGGSVKTENIRDLLSEPNIDGALIGGASLDVRSFAQI